MCGIFAFFGKDIEPKSLSAASDKIVYRGPDSSTFEYGKDYFFGFHRLSIIDPNPRSDQPIHLDELVLMCNGEIFNYKKLIQDHHLEVKTHSDCEVILHLYKKYGMEKTLNMLDGVFAFVIWDKENKIIHAARDPFGVRPLFWSKKDNNIIFASEAKAIKPVMDSPRQFPPGSYWNSLSNETVIYVEPLGFEDPTIEWDSAKIKIRELFVSAVEKRLMSDREIGCLLSGGLDSSLVASLVTKMNAGYRLIDGEWKLFPELNNGLKTKTFSIGMPNSPDILAARKVAEWIGSEHHEVILQPEDFISSLEDVIYRIESYDTTSVRASVGNYLVSKYIKENTDCKVIFNGDGSDEVCIGYLYNINAPSEEALQKDSLDRVLNISYYDVLRSDRTISSNGLEPRTPFLDKTFVRYYLSIPAKFKTFDKKERIEKQLLRDAFRMDNLLPEEILYRHKCAFSDGVSTQEKSWHKILQADIENKISDEDFISQVSKLLHCKPLLKESLYYRNIFCKYYPNEDEMIPDFWMPRWTDVIDPSARELNNYVE